MRNAEGHFAGGHKKDAALQGRNETNRKARKDRKEENELGHATGLRPFRALRSLR
ncbi:MAG: hypothetical protein RDV41_03765 [Planctomycetota bacterium]|nr:hypothetical protein [Planctomycetota bacterium]